MKDPDNKARLIARNTIYLFVGQVLTGVSTLALMAVVARKLGVDKFGVYTLALTIAGIFGIASNFGSAHLIIREIAIDKEKTEKYLVNGTIVKICLNIIIFLILLGLVHRFYSINLQLVIYLACFSIILKRFMEFYISFFNAYEKMHLNAIVSSLQGILVFIVCLAILLTGIDEVSYLFCGHIFVNLLMTILSILLLFKMISPKISGFDLTFSWLFLKRSVPFALFSLGAVIYFQTDTVMLSVMKGEVAVGFYQAAIRLVVALEIIAGLLGSAMYPTISRTFVHSKEEAGLMMERALRYMLLLGLPMAVGTTLLSKKIILLVFGAKFVPSIVLLQILAWTIPVRFCGHILGTTLSASDNQNLRALATGLSAGLNIGLNLILIPRYSYNGAAVASVITCGFLVTFYYYSIMIKESYHIALRKVITPSLLSSVIMGIIVYLVKGMSIFLVVGLGIVVYLTSLILLRGINGDDYQMLKALVLNRKGEKYRNAHGCT